MMLKHWDDLPEYMQIPEVRPYYDILDRKRFGLVLKRIFDFFGALCLFVILAIPMGVIAVLVKLDSKGPVMYRQERVTTCGKHFRIHKFRTMVANADKIGTAVTVGNDARVTRIGRVLRKYRLDELPQLFDVISGDMSIVGTRPEAVKYVEQYKPAYLATLLLPAGVTNLTCILYADEAERLSDSENADQVYLEEILPEKMKWNLLCLERFSPMNEIRLMFMTVFSVLGKDYAREEALLR